MHEVYLEIQLAIVWNCGKINIQMNTFLLDYIPIIIFLGIAIGMASLIMIASWIVAKQNPDEEKLSPYECGFDAFEDTRSQFDVTQSQCTRYKREGPSFMAQRSKPIKTCIYI